MRAIAELRIGIRYLFRYTGNMKVRIEIDTRTFVRFWLVVIGFAMAALALYSARSALFILSFALFLALALNAPVSYLANYLPGKSRTGATALAYVMVVAFLGVFMALVVPPIAEQTAKFIDTIPSIVDKASTEWHGVASFIDKYHLQPQLESAITSLKNNTVNWAASIGSNAFNGLGSLLSGVASLFLVLVLSFLMVIEGPAWLARLWTLYTDEARMEHHRKLAGKMYRVVTGYIMGQITVSAIGALFAGITVFILSMFFNAPSNLALPTIAIAFTLSLIPMFGATFGGVLIALLLIFNDFGAGVAFAIYFIIYQQIENNFISPTIQASKVSLSALSILASVTIGIYVFGLVGGIISIPVAGSLKVLLEDYLHHTKKKRVHNDQPLVRLAKKIHGEA